ncbi:MAG: lysophospholipid acyltransferase family protein [Kiloniellales bacterium]
MVESLGSPLRACVRLLIYGSFTFACMPLQAVAVLLGLDLRRSLPVWYHRRCCRILGIQVERRGRRSRVMPTLYVSNHTSYLDITVLGSLIPGSFVAKAEVARWPLFGWLAKLQRTVFIERRASRTGDHRSAITERLEQGDNLILFPEGTSDDGNRVLPFKSGLLAAAACEPQGQPLTVQPVTIGYTRLDGLPLGRHLRPLFAWYGDMDMAPHLWQLAGLGRLTVAVQFHPPVRLADFASRKALSEHCYRQVSAGLSRALAGRPPPSRQEPSAQDEPAAQGEPAPQGEPALQGEPAPQGKGVALA